MTTIKDLAKAAGVSITTVSRALNGYSDVNEKTRSRIKKLADELSYRPNAQAQSLVLKKTNTIGVIISEIKRSNAKDAFAFEVLCGINDRAGELNYDILLFSTNPNKQLRKSYSDLCRERNVDGAILQGLRVSDPYLKEVIDQPHFPCVLIDIPVAGERVGHVTTDNVNGAREAVRHLIELGHKRIAMINGYDEASVSRERLTGYMVALQESGMAYEPALVTDGRFSEEGGMDAMQQILEKHPDVTAVFCASDLMALGALRALERAGRSVPDSMSLVGFDDISIASYCSPNLTTVRQEKYELGYQAAQLLIDMLEGRQVRHKVMLPNELIVRGSTSRKR
ncbi:MAG TPA: LacI family DNA-binding transcriptional regulator [Paenibacillus sp.]|uniref:LacI family DNA-binding transcriptional regulator n=1 Tax=Paenibacillus sp. TaxID=58172 RepID=UPI002CFA39ED|nr:LacI family DNA-binding transcriptional regulator [Paenibacillus sp.]HUC92161.1 LacI family DNA-binding transcriptional regulator [Paenibacillus sp.]